MAQLPDQLDLAALATVVLERCANPRPGVHGPGHWQNVAEIGLRLADLDGDADREVICCFALLHDSERHNDYEDPGHGPRAAVLARKLHAEGLLALTDQQLEVLCHACETHTTAGPTVDPTVGCCYDADRLTLWRVGIRPDTRFLSTEAAVEDPDWIDFGRHLIDADPMTWQHIDEVLHGTASPPVRDADDGEEDRPVSLIDELAKTWNDPEPLHPDLEDHVQRRAGLPFLHHPLMVMPLFAEQMNGMANQMYEHKSAEADQSLAERNWAKYLLLHEKPYRLDAFSEIAADMTDAEYWHHLASIWTTIENVWQFASEWRALLCAGRPGREHMMNSAERDRLAAMPERVQVHRGFWHPSGGAGLSWTTDPSRAEWFARRFCPQDATDPPVVRTGTVARTDIIALLDGRGEMEVVLLPENVADRSDRDV